jgi:hypothetical protein
MPAVILNSVGVGGKNNPSDVMVIQALLNQVPYAIGGPQIKLTVTGFIDTATKYAIGNFQQYWFKWSDGRVDPNGNTLNFLNTKSQPLHLSLPYQPAEPQFLPQRRTNNCWAAVGAMMHNWKKGYRLTVEDFVSDRCNGTFKEWYQINKALEIGSLKEFVTVTLGMRGMTYAELCPTTNGVTNEMTPSRWLDVLKAYKAVVVQHVVRDGGSNYLHARILCGMTGTGKPESTSVRVIDPWTGAELPKEMLPVSPSYNSKLIPYTQFAAEFAVPSPLPSVLRLWKY